MTFRENNTLGYTLFAERFVFICATMWYYLCIDGGVQQAYLMQSCTDIFHDILQNCYTSIVFNSKIRICGLCYPGEIFRFIPLRNNYFCCALINFLFFHAQHTAFYIFLRVLYIIYILYARALHTGIHINHQNRAEGTRISGFSQSISFCDKSSVRWANM